MLSLTDSCFIAIFFRKQFVFLFSLSQTPSLHSVNSVCFLEIPEANNPQRFTHFHITYELVFHLFLKFDCQRKFSKNRQVINGDQKIIFDVPMIFAIHSYIHHATASIFAGKDLCKKTPLHRLRKGSCAHALDHRLQKYLTEIL